MASITLNEVGKRYADGTHAVRDLNLEIPDGEFIVLVGPSGCGKTTVLRMVAGLEEITDGEIRIGEHVVNSLDPRARDVAMVFQNYALYPHMTVFENLAYPLRARRLPKREIHDRVQRVARLIGLEREIKRKPRALSGGQRQRVAMGRAIVREPQVFLMDEPLSNLDAKLRSQMRAEIAGLQRELNVTTIYVTHDQVEAMTMGTRIAVLRGGLLQQQGSPRDLYDAPENLFVATFIGSPAMNVLEGALERGADGLVCVFGDQKISLALEGSRRRALEAYVGRTLAVGIRSEHLTDAADDRRERPRLRGQVKFVELLGAEQLVQVELPVKPAVADDVLDVADDVDPIARAAVLSEAKSNRALVTARFDAHASAKPDDVVDVVVTPERLQFFDLATGRAIR